MRRAQPKRLCGFPGFPGRLYCGAGLLATLVVLLGTAPGARDDELVLFREDFEHGLSDRWVERGFPSISRKNSFSVSVEEDGNRYLEVQSSRSYSGKGIYMTFSPRRCPHVSWRWRISDTISSADITRKEGDDAAAKLYVVFDGPSFWNPLDKRILVYVWDNAVPVGSILQNAWLPEKERMLVLESGNDKVGQWVAESADLESDFRRAFPGESPGEVEALAFLADTDNTSAHVSAGFDDLVIRCKMDAGETDR